jgi:hypothetical protein
LPAAFSFVCFSSPMSLPIRVWSPADDPASQVVNSPARIGSDRCGAA